MFWPREGPGRNNNTIIPTPPGREEAVLNAGECSGLILIGAIQLATLTLLVSRRVH